MVSQDEFIDGQIDGVVVREAIQFDDDRGWLIELFRHDELPQDVWPAMAYVSETLPGVARGPHAHHDQTDFFAFVGPGDYAIYLWDARDDSPTFGVRQKLIVGESNRLLLVVPPGVVHAYKNVGTQRAWLINAPERRLRRGQVLCSVFRKRKSRRRARPCA